jgi:hypothetical protein
MLSVAGAPLQHYVGGRCSSDENGKLIEWGDALGTPVTLPTKGEEEGVEGKRGRLGTEESVNSECGHRCANSVQPTPH